MKKAVILMLVVALAGLLAQPASAAIATGQFYRIDNPIANDNNGGPFKMTEVVANVNGAAAKSGGEVFWTFCAQSVGEVFNPGHSYVVGAIQTGTEVTPKTYLTGYAAWVYDTFLNAIGSNSPATVYTQTQRSLLQWAVWAGLVYDSSDGYAELKAATTANNSSLAPGQKFLTPTQESTLDGFGYGFADFEAAVAANNWDDVDDLGDIKVLVMLNGNIQDMLGRVPDDSIPGVPEPASMLVWSLLGGALGLVGVRRRRA